MQPDGQIVEVSLHVHQNRDKDRAVLVSQTGDIEAAVWLPKTEIDMEMKGPDQALILMPKWLAASRRIEF